MHEVGTITHIVARNVQFPPNSIETNRSQTRDFNVKWKSHTPVSKSLIVVSLELALSSDCMMMYHMPSSNQSA